MDAFIGYCVGGPEDGKLFAHWQKTKKFYRPMMAVTFSMPDSAQIEAIEIGEYKLNDFAQWHWWETESGQAFKKLFRTISSHPSSS